MQRRSFLKSLVAGAAGAAIPKLAFAALPKSKITAVRIFAPPRPNQMFNQSDIVIAVETDVGITGYGDGGTKDMLEQCAASLIGKDPFRIEAIWQEMYMAYFYSPGHEKVHALGALDNALWDIKGKALGAPLHQILGGSIRNYLESYPTSGVPAPGGGRTLRERAKAVIDAGYRLYRADASVAPAVNNVFNPRTTAAALAQAAKEIREGVGPNGDWAIDLHQRFDLGDAVRACKVIEEYEPFLVEDPVREEQFTADIPRLRQQTSCRLAAGEEWGQRWEQMRLVENHDIDFNRCTLPNVGGITEFLKIMALCETHAVGIVPHFTGPIATAALVHCLSTFPQQVVFEYNYGERKIDYLPEFLTFKEGKLYTNDRPGIGVTVDTKPLKPLSVVTERANPRLYFRPDGSPTHW